MAIDLEAPDPAPAADPAPVAATPAPTEPVPATPVDPDEEAAVEVQGQKLVPLSALKAARAENKPLKEKAQQLDTIAQWYAEKKPYIDLLEQNPQLFQRPADPVPAAPQADPELVELARSLDFYKADGSPDLDRADKHQKIIARQATKIAQQMVGPVAQNAAQQRSVANFQAVAVEKLPNGQPIDQNLLAQMWRTLPAEHTADPRVAAVVRDLTIAQQLRNSPLPPAPVAPVNAPLHTEGVGAVPRPATKMTDAERAVASARGMTAEKYTELTKGFVSGRPITLED